ncbi:MAG TPA: DegV family protein [Cellulomonas sp.]
MRRPGDLLPGALLRRLRGRRGAAGPATEPLAERRVVVVTDSTACLTAEDAAACGVVVVPLDVAADVTRYRDGIDLDGDGLAALLAAGRRVTTSQPAPAVLVAAYEQAARDGAVEVVSVHLSGELSGTVRAAGLAAQLAPLPVRVVDSRSTGMGLGFAVLAAAEAAAGWSPDGASVARTAERVGRSTSAWFLVDSLDHLRRGGRLGGTAAALGTVLGLRPVLALRAGRIEVSERARTRRGARERLVELVVAEAVRRGVGDGPGAGGERGAGAAAGSAGGVRVAVQHLGRAEVAEDLAERVRHATGLPAHDVLVREVGAVLGGHLGPGVLAVVITDR